MKIKEFRCKCGHDDFFFADKGNQIGIYCSYCGKWFKWADKDEQNLRMKQVSVIDKIRNEIERCGGNDEKAFCKSLNESYKLGLREAIKIIDKYLKDGE